jgi:hypothetical protein
VIKAYGFGQLPDMTGGRKEVRRLTRQSFVPALLLDDGKLVTGSDEISGWARVHPAAAS